MPLFDYYMMIDWSGGNSRGANRANCIWIAHGRRADAEPVCESPLSRTDAIRRVIELLEEGMGANERGLVCFDFAFGYPRGFAEHLPQHNDAQEHWQRVWHYLTTVIQDDLGTEAGRVPSNRNNRFDVANGLNGMMSAPELRGPFWSAEPNWRQQIEQAGQDILIPQQWPHDFVSNQGVTIPPFRYTDEVVDSDFPFRLFGNGSVGGQMLTGIPRLNQLRNAEQWRVDIEVWPFETGWASTEDESWLASNIRLILAEIYPSVRPPFDDAIVDRGQVRAMWQWAHDLDQDNALHARFARPTTLIPTRCCLKRVDTFRCPQVDPHGQTSRPAFWAWRQKLITERKPPVFRLTGKIEGGSEITDVEAWFEHAPPVGKAEQWKDYRSAKELARAWCRHGVVRVPEEFTDLLSSRDETKGLTLEHVVAEMEIDFDNLGTPRNADLALWGRHRRQKRRIAVTVEAKADEPFGDKTIGRRLQDGFVKKDSSLPGRISRLSCGILGRDVDPEIAPLRYQLFTALAATAVLAKQKSAKYGVLVIHEFISLALDFDKVVDNANDLKAFVQAIRGWEDKPLMAGRLLPFVALPGSESVPKDVLVSIGKTRSLIPFGRGGRVLVAQVGKKSAQSLVIE